MSRALVLDAEALSSLSLRQGQRFSETRAAVEAGGGVVVTGDERNLERLAAPYPNVQVAPI